MTPQLDPPPPGTYCPDCGEEMVLTDYCGACAEWLDRQRRDAIHRIEDGEER